MSGIHERDTFGCLVSAVKNLHLSNCILLFRATGGITELKVSLLVCIAKHLFLLLFSRIFFRKVFFCILTYMRLGPWVIGM